MSAFNKEVGWGDCNCSVNSFQSGNHRMFLPQMINSRKHPNTSHVFYCTTEYFNNPFFLMSLTNRVSLIQTFVALVILEIYNLSSGPHIIHFSAVAKKRKNLSKCLSWTKDNNKLTLKHFKQLQYYTVSGWCYILIQLLSLTK